MKRKLPIGIQTFRTIREDGYYYVDKTAHVWKLVSEGTHYFLSRPRRFGKSLLVDTLKELFEGNEPLFRGLAIHAHWPWSDRHPVVRLSFGSGDFTRAGNPARGDDGATGSPRHPRRRRGALRHRARALQSSARDAARPHPAGAW